MTSSLRLTRPATVRGRVTDASGKPVAGREVRASAADRLENRYYDPTTDDGNRRHLRAEVHPPRRAVHPGRPVLARRQAGTRRNEPHVESGTR